MKVLFICGSMEPTKDGVGDYTRKLSGALARSGKDVAVIAIHDTLLCEHQIEYQSDLQSRIPVLRLNSSLPWKVKRKKAVDFKNDFVPDWISLQYVPYAFHKKGLPVKLGDILAELGKNANVNIMYHETWVGIKQNVPFHHLVYKHIQERIAKGLEKRLKPKFNLTSNRLFQLELKRVGIDSEVLHLFSTISKAQKDMTFIRSVFERNNLSLNDRDKYHLIGLFGNINNEIDFYKILSKLNKTNLGQGLQTVFITFGNVTDRTDLDSLITKLNNELKVIQLNGLEESKISSVLQILDSSISSTPSEYISKSGVYAAMKLHNVLVIKESTMQINKYYSEIVKWNDYLNRTEASEWNVDFIAIKFYEYLRLYSNL